jgi:hypothetical protein
MLVSPLAGTSIAGDDFVLAEWRDDGESSSERHEPGIRDMRELFRAHASELLA